MLIVKLIFFCEAVKNIKIEKPLAVAISPSGCAIFCIAVGATQIGKSIFSPSIVVDISMIETSRSTRGRNLILNTRN